MPYQINTSDGNVLTSLPDGSLDTDSSSLTLIGRNSVNFGEAVNENFVKLLENFADNTQPNNALTGQLWYDTTSGNLNVFNGQAFRSVAGSIVSPTTPNNLNSGDIWVDSDKSQMYFYDGANLMLVGPGYTVDQGLSGIIIDTVVSTTNAQHTIGKLYIDNTLLGIFSKSAFNAKSAIAGYMSSNTPRINIGFNASNLTNMEFDVVAEKANSLKTTTGAIISADNVADTTNNTTFDSDVNVTVGSMRVNKHRFSLDTTGLTNNAEIAAVLDGIFPRYHPTEAASGVASEGAELFVHTTKSTINGSVIEVARVNKIYIMGATGWVFDSNVT